MKSGYVAIIGRPNVGKSTLMNHLIGQKIAITANKPQTTRNRIRTVYTDRRGQIVFLDTPGIHKAETKLGTYMVDAALKTIPEADVVLLIVEPTPRIGRGEQAVIDLLKPLEKPVILVVNKIDRVDPDTVRETSEAYQALMHFDTVLKVSALHNSGVSSILDVLFSRFKEGPMFFDEDTVTDQPMRQIVAEIVREKALRLLKEEIPHGIAVVVDSMKQRKSGIWDIEATITTERESHKGIIIGKQGQMLKEIGREARIDSEKMLEAKVNLKLWVKVRENWKDNDLWLKNFGLYPEDK